MPKLIFGVPQPDLAEAFQYLNIKFALAKKDDNGDYVTTTPLFQCRDYFSDSIYSWKTGKKLTEIYGFKADPSNVQDSILIVNNPPECLFSNLKFLFDIEEKFGFKKTSIIPLDGTKDYAFEFDKDWLLNSVLFAYYTATIRILSYTKIEKNPYTECIKFLDTVCKEGTEYYYRLHLSKLVDIDLNKLKKDIAFPSILKEEVYYIHGSCGIYTYLNSPTYFKQELQQ